MLTNWLPQSGNVTGLSAKRSQSCPQLFCRSGGACNGRFPPVPHSSENRDILDILGPGSGARGAMTTQPEVSEER
jgi:hypothetical protein